MYVCMYVCMYVHAHMHSLLWSGNYYRTLLIYIVLLCSETTSSIGVQLKCLKGVPSGTARVEVTGYQRNGQVHMYIYAYA